MLNQKSIGIEIANDQLHIVCLEAQFSGLKIFSQTRIPLSADTPEARLASTGVHIKNYLDQNGLTSVPLFFCIPTHHVVMRTIELPLALKENLHETLGYEMEKFVPFSADTVYFDASIIAEDKKHGTLNALLTVIKKSTMDPFLALPAAVGDISGIQDNGCAIANATIHLKNITHHNKWAILHDDGSTINFLSMEGENLQAAREWQSSDNIAEKLTEEVTGYKKQAKQDDESLELVILGQRAETDLISLAKNLKGLVPKAFDPKTAGLSSPNLLPAFGTALMGLNKAATPVNLLPRRMRKKPSRLGLYLFLILFSLTLLAGFAWGGSHLLRQGLAAEKLDNELTRLRAESVKVEKIKNETQNMAVQIEALNTLRIQRTSLLMVLQEISRKVPETAWLRSLTINDQSILIDGFADSATELIPLLDSSPLFENVVFKSTITKRQDGKNIFKIGLDIHSNSQETP